MNEVIERLKKEAMIKYITECQYTRNKVIERLKKEAMVKYITECQYTGAPSVSEELHIDLFAQLIVKECSKVAERAVNDDRELRCVSEVLNAHFGVK